MNICNNHDKTYHGILFIFNLKCFYFHFKNRKKDFQIFITTVIKPIIEFFRFVFEIFLFMLQEKEKDLKIFITIMISNCYLEISH